MVSVIEVVLRSCYIIIIVQFFVYCCIVVQWIFWWPLVIVSSTSLCLVWWQHQLWPCFSKLILLLASIFMDKSSTEYVRLYSWNASCTCSTHAVSHTCTHTHTTHVHTCMHACSLYIQFYHVYTYNHYIFLLHAVNVMIPVYAYRYFCSIEFSRLPKVITVTLHI